MGTTHRGFEIFLDDHAGRDFALALSSLTATIIVAVYGIIGQETKTEERLLEHSKKLIDEVNETWLRNENYWSYQLVPYKLVFFVASYGIYGRSTITDNFPPHVDQVEQHLKSGYPELFQEYEQAKRVSREQLEKVLAVWSNLESLVSKEMKALLASIQEWDSSIKTRPAMESFDLKRTVECLYMSLVSSVLFENSYPYFRPPQKTHANFDYFDVGDGILQTTDEGLALRFYQFTQDLIARPTLRNEIKSLGEGRRRSTLSWTSSGRVSRKSKTTLETAT